MGIGKKIRELRVRMGYTQEALADKIGVTPSAVGNYEHEFSFPKEEVLLRLFGALGCSPNELFGEEDIFTAEEAGMLRKYSALDTHGKRVVNAVLELELKRVEGADDADEMLIAARKGKQSKLRFKDPGMKISDLPDYKGGGK